MTTRERDFPFTLTRDATDNGDDGLTFEGYAAVFHSVTHINDQDGEYDEVIAPGAFKRSLSRTKPMLMFNHGKHPLIGEMPLGRITEIREDDVGLYVKARLSDNWLIQPVRDAIRDGAIEGMSFRFEVKQDDWQARSNQPRLRTLKEVRMPECGPVVWPAYAATTASVRSSLHSLQGVLPDAFDIVEPESNHTRAAFEKIHDFKASTEDPKICATCGKSEADGMHTKTPADAAANSAKQYGAVRDDEGCDPDMRTQIEEAIEMIWAVDDNKADAYVFEVNNDEAVFTLMGAAVSEHPGLWRVAFTYNPADGSVSLGDPQPVQSLEPTRDLEHTEETARAQRAKEQGMPDTNRGPVGSRREATDLGPSEEPAVDGPSDELAAEETANEQSARAERINADRRAQMRGLYLSRAGLA